MTLWIDEARLVNYPAYIAPFTPPTSAYPAVLGTDSAAISGSSAIGATMMALEGWSPVAPIILLHCDGPASSTSFPDSSGRSHVATSQGSAHVDASVSKFGGGSAAFISTSDYLSLDGSNDFAFGTGDFTVECQAYYTGNDVFDLIDWSPGPQIKIGTGNVLIYLIAGTVVISGTTVLNPNTWYHVAISRSSGVTRLFLNGVQEGSSYSGFDNITITASRPVIGTRS